MHFRMTDFFLRFFMKALISPIFSTRSLPFLQQWSMTGFTEITMKARVYTIGKVLNLELFECIIIHEIVRSVHVVALWYNTHYKWNNSRTFSTSPCSVLTECAALNYLSYENRLHYLIQRNVVRALVKNWYKFVHLLVIYWNFRCLKKMSEYGISVIASH